MNNFKFLALCTLLTVLMVKSANAQLKETVQMATLTPTVFVLGSNDIIRPHKLHFTVSTVLYLTSYMVTESHWKAILISLSVGVTKELIYDGLLNKGEPWIQDVKWNALGVAQGAVFTLSLKL